MKYEVLLQTVASQVVEVEADSPEDANDKAYEQHTMRAGAGDDHDYGDVVASEITAEDGRVWREKNFLYGDLDENVD